MCLRDVTRWSVLRKLLFAFLCAYEGYKHLMALCLDISMALWHYVFMAYIKTTVYLDEEELLKLMTLMLAKQKSINISALIRSWIKTYLEKNGIESVKDEPDEKVLTQKEESKVKEVKETYSTHDFGPTGNGWCFKHQPPHKKGE